MIHFIITLILWGILFSIKAKKSLHMLQQNLYNTESRYIKWINKNFNKLFLNIDTLILISFIFLIFFIY